MKNILITGVNGFIGRNIYTSLKKKYNVQGIGNKNKKLKSLDVKKVINTKITKKNLKENFKNIDLIIHCAGSGLVNHSDKPNIFKRDIKTILNILNFISNNKKKISLIFISSASVYGNRYSSKINEKSNLYPVSNYAIGKKESEKICEHYSNKFNVGIKVLRVTSLYGPGLNKQVIYDSTLKILNKKNNFYGTGDEVRDFLHIDDFTNLIKKIVRKKISSYEILNCGSGKGYKIKNIIKKILKENNSKMKINFTKKNKKTNPRYIVVNIKNIKKNYNWTPKKKFNMELINLVRWIKKKND